ncbi:hypothetical protein BJX68DRAFT_262172 [Aspergillus pseudodeflectus]|uniref:25S rRNA (uridine-N(3))-methyltransferase BMT5-like domain-containing protein n=1 Tax=Aspergillus pseudodeflectus TaxID=176178 RepID=A0ABR4L6I2_9EURO
MSSFAKLSTKSNNYNGNANGANAQQRAKSEKGGGGGGAQKGQQKQQQNRRPIVPFRRRDRILCIGEGDFSFAHSLATHHRCKNLIATCYDSQETLYGKYPRAEKNIAEILAASFSHKSKDEKQQQNTSPKVLFSVDAKKLGSPSGGGKDVRIGFPRKEKKRPAWKKEDLTRPKRASAGGPWDMICFNFPHVGGLSTDVNRQVRANQELLVAFFKACLPLLAAKPENDDDEDEEGEEEEGWGSETEGSGGGEDGGGGGSDNEDGASHVRAKDEHRTEPGQILVTLFEGEPYTLWNIRDLARHAGLKVVTSFRFPWACYRGYSHARTLGEIEGKDGARGGWRGEDREARMYVFEVKTDDNTHSLRSAAGKRKKRSATSDDSDSD